MRNSFGRRIFALIIQIIIIIAIIIFIKNNRTNNKKYSYNVNNMTKQEIQIEEQKQLNEILIKYRKLKIEELYKEANISNVNDIEDRTIMIKFYRIILDIYKTELLTENERFFLSGALESIVEHDELEDVPELKEEISNAIIG